MEDLTTITDLVLQDFCAVPNVSNLSEVRVVNCLHPQFYNGNVCRCGKCILCRVSQRSEWSFRLDLEAIETCNNSFVTLTYDPMYVPMELVKKDLQDFNKRFRYNLSYPVRFFASGEYGDNFTKRPHFHLVFFGLDAVNFPDVARSWSKGFVDCKVMSNAHTTYVCGYVQKKISFFYQDNRIPDNFYDMSFIERCNWCLENGIDDMDCRLRPFALMSRMPGIAYNWYEKHKLELLDKLFIPLNGKKHPIPRYFRKMLDEEFPDWKLKFIDMCESCVIGDFEKFFKKYHNDNLDDFQEWLYDRVKQRAVDFKRKNELYLAKKRERNIKKYGGNVL